MWLLEYAELDYGITEVAEHLEKLFFKGLPKPVSAAQEDLPAQRGTFLTDQLNNIGLYHYLFYYKPCFSNQGLLMLICFSKIH